MPDVGTRIRPNVSERIEKKILTRNTSRKEGLYSFWTKETVMSLTVVRVRSGGGAFAHYCRSR